MKLLRWLTVSLTLATAEAPTVLSLDKLFKLLNIVVDVVFKLLRFEFIANTDKPDVIILFTTFNDDNNVIALFNVVVPDTFNDDINVVI